MRNAKLPTAIITVMLLVGVAIIVAYLSSRVRSLDGLSTGDAGNVDDFGETSMRLVSIVDVGQYWITDAKWEGQATLGFRNQGGLIGLQMQQEQALQIDRNLRIRLGIQGEDFYPMGEIVDSGSVLRNPVHNEEMVFTTTEGNEKDAYSFPTKITIRFYAYDTNQRILRNLLVVNYQDRESSDILRLIGITSDGHAITYKTSSGDSPGPCFNPWFDQRQRFAFDVNGLQPTLAPWSTPEWKVEQERKATKQTCS